MSGARPPAAQGTLQTALRDMDMVPAASRPGCFPCGSLSPGHLGLGGAFLDLQQAQHSACQSEDRVEAWGGEVTADPLGCKLSVPLSAHWSEGSCDSQLAELL